jgi:putative DNA primase/helicase
MGKRKITNIGVFIPWKKKTNNWWNKNPKKTQEKMRSWKNISKPLRDNIRFLESQKKLYENNHDDPNDTYDYIQIVNKLCDLKKSKLQELVDTHRNKASEYTKNEIFNEVGDIQEMLTEVGNAEAFVKAVNGTAKYVTRLNKWVYWNENGRWKVDDNGYIKRKFKEVVNSLSEVQSQIMATLGDEANDEEKKEAVKIANMVGGWIKKSRSRSVIENSIALSACEEGMTVDYTEFDSKGEYLGVENGVIDLRTGELIQGDPSYLMMMSAPVCYEPQAECPISRRFLHDITEGDEDKIELLQQIAGSGLVGNTKEKMFMFQGSGSNGKSTFINILLHILGATENRGYKAGVNPKVFVEHVNNPEYFLAKLKAARLITMSETSNGGILNDTLVKQVVDSEEGLQARVVRGEAFDLSVVGTVLLLTNNLPKVISTDEGTWRRLCLVTFNRTFTEDEKDRTLMSQLKTEKEGILNWCVQGAIRYFANGKKFVIPKSVENETKEWRLLEDKLGSFIDEKMVQHPQSSVKLSQVMEVYKDWCAARNQYAGSEKELKKQLMTRGMSVVKTGQRGWNRLVGWKLLIEGETRHYHDELMDDLVKNNVSPLFN